MLAFSGRFSIKCLEGISFNFFVCFILNVSIGRIKVQQRYLSYYSAILLLLHILQNFPTIIVGLSTIIVGFAQQYLSHYSRKHMSYIQYFVKTTIYVTYTTIFVLNNYSPKTYTTIFVLNNYSPNKKGQLLQTASRQYLSSTGWLKAGYGLVMLMMMKMMLLMMTLDRKNMIQVRVSDRKGKEIDQSSMLKPSIYTVTLPRVRAERQMF